MHKPLRFSDCSILLHSALECDNVSIFIIICFVCSNEISVVVVLGLGRHGLSLCVLHSGMGFVLGGSKLACFGRWQAMLLSWLVLLVGVNWCHCGLLLS